MKNTCKIILSALLIIGYGENVIASSSDEESKSSTNYTSNNTVFNSSRLNSSNNLTEEEYINEVILDIRDILLSFMIFKINVSNAIQATHNCNTLGWKFYNKEFQKLRNKYKYKFIEMLKSNNINLQNSSNFRTILETLLRELKNSFSNNTHVFMNILQFLENISKSNINVMQNNIRIVKDKLLMTDINELSNKIEKNFGKSYNQIETSIQSKIDKLIRILNKLNNIKINDNKLKEINNKLIVITNNILEYLYLTKECFSNIIGYESAIGILTATGVALLLDIILPIFSSVSK